MSRFNLVVFDCDGVLVDSEPVVFGVFASEMRKLGMDVTTEALMARHIGLTMKQSRKIFAEEEGITFDEAWEANVRQLMAEEMDRGLDMIAGVDQVIEKVVATDTPIAVASQSRSFRIRQSLKLTNLDRFFSDNIYSAHDVGRPKPDPDVYLHAAKMAGQSPAQSAVVEDTPTGTRAGVAAGMTVFGYAAHGQGQRLLDAGAAEVINSMDDLPHLLGV